MCCSNIVGKYVKCIVMNLVRLSGLKVLVMNMEDMNKDKSDVLNVQYSSNGMDFGVPAVDVC